ncbi:MAG: hypothetical protein LUO93_02860 [Methanomicrobiales archaeon]|nr:hypothetical protein [Methanomicrobiales archaeon]
MTWSSEDELAFVRYLYHRKNLIGLVNYRRLLPYRSFYGAGMYVDQRLLQMSLDTHIDALEADLLR